MDESDMLPDEREVIAERMGDLDELDEDDRLTVEEVADELDIDLDDPTDAQRELVELSERTQERFEEEGITEDDIDEAIRDVREDDGSD